jgi:dTDP-4-amino-4,6-dideoxygalactose transaminase
MAIARGRFSHSIFDDVYCLFHALFTSKSTYKYRDTFELEFSRYVGRDKCVVFPFARTALFCYLKSLNLPSGTKILMPSITIKAMLDVVIELELTPIFVDSNVNDAFINTTHLKEILNDNPDIRIAFLTYLFGVTPDLEEILILLKSHKIGIIEDFSQNLNCEYNSRKLGTMGEVGIYSSSSLKSLDLHGGGLFVCDDPEIYRRIKIQQIRLNKHNRKSLVIKIIKCFLKNLATTKIAFNLFTFPLIKIGTKFSDEMFSRLVGRRTVEPINTLPLSWFEEFSEAQAKFGLKAIRRIQKNDERREYIAHQYNKSIKNLNHIQGCNGSKSIYWQYLVFPNNPKKFRQHMLQNGVDTAQTSLINISNIYEYISKQSFTPNSKYLHEHGVYVPIYASLRRKEIERIITHVNNFKNN